jgi:hypothetical protein
MQRKRVPVVAVGVLAIALSGCASGVEAVSNGEPNTEAAIEQSQSPAQFSDTHAASLGVAFDYEPIDGTLAIAARSDIVISGKVVDALEGPSVGRPDDEFPDIPLVMLKIEVTEVLQGSLAEGGDGFVYAAILNGPADVFLRAIPPGTPVGFYGNLVSNERMDGDIPVINSGLGKPEGQRMYRETGAQGLMFETQSDTGPMLWWSSSQYSAPGTIADAMPGGPLDGHDETMNR